MKIIIRTFIYILTSISLVDSASVFYTLHGVALQSVSMTIILLIFFIVMMLKEDNIIKSDQLNNRRFLTLKIIVYIILLIPVFFDNSCEIINPLASHSSKLLTDSFEIIKVVFIEILTKILFSIFRNN